MGGWSYCVSACDEAKDHGRGMWRKTAHFVAARKQVDEEKEAGVLISPLRIYLQVTTRPHPFKISPPLCSTTV